MKTISELEDDDCRWPVEGGYCGERKEDKRKPYCAVHTKEAGKPLPPRRSPDTYRPLRGRGGWLSNK